jgi:hypothetical protein
VPSSSVSAIYPHHDIEPPSPSALVDEPSLSPSSFSLNSDHSDPLQLGPSPPPSLYSIKNTFQSFKASLSLSSLSSFFHSLYLPLLSRIKNTNQAPVNISSYLFSFFLINSLLSLLYVGLFITLSLFLSCKYRPFHQHLSIFVLDLGAFVSLSLLLFGLSLHSLSLYLLYRNNYAKYLLGKYFYEKFHISLFDYNNAHSPYYSTSSSIDADPPSLSAFDTNSQTDPLSISFSANDPLASPSRPSTSSSLSPSLSYKEHYHIHLPPPNKNIDSFLEKCNHLSVDESINSIEIGSNISNNISNNFSSNLGNVNINMNRSLIDNHIKSASLSTPALSTPSLSHVSLSPSTSDSSPSSSLSLLSLLSLPVERDNILSTLFYLSILYYLSLLSLSLLLFTQYHQLLDYIKALNSSYFQHHFHFRLKHHYPSSSSLSTSPFSVWEEDPYADASYIHKNFSSFFLTCIIISSLLIKFESLSIYLLYQSYQYLIGKVNEHGLSINYPLSLPPSLSLAPFKDPLYKRGLLTQQFYLSTHLLLGLIASILYAFYLYLKHHLSFIPLHLFEMSSIGFLSIILFLSILLGLYRFQIFTYNESTFIYNTHFYSLLFVAFSLFFFFVLLLYRTSEAPFYLSTHGSSSLSTSLSLTESNYYLELSAQMKIASLAAFVLLSSLLSFVGAYVAYSLRRIKIKI